MPRVGGLLGPRSRVRMLTSVLIGLGTTGNTSKSTTSAITAHL